MFLGPTNVRIYTDREHLYPELYPGAWALVDSNVTLSLPREEMITIHSKLFVINAVSPQPRSAWKEWLKQRNAVMAVMKAWSWEELYIGGSVDAIHPGNSYTH